VCVCVPTAQYANRSILLAPIVWRKKKNKTIFKRGVTGLAAGIWAIIITITECVVYNTIYCRCCTAGNKSASSKPTTVRSWYGIALKKKMLNLKNFNSHPRDLSHVTVYFYNIYKCITCRLMISYNDLNILSAWDWTRPQMVPVRCEIYGWNSCVSIKIICVCA